MPDMTLFDAIHKRRSVRAYTDQAVDRQTILALLKSAVRAPTAMHEEPWVFSVIQDKTVLKQLSDAAKILLLHENAGGHPARGGHALDMVRNPDFNIFYDAGTLIVIWGKPMGPFVTADCWLAAQTLLLAATAKGLGSCVIGFAVAALNAPDWKKKLGVADDMTAYAPVIVGIPEGTTPPTSRKEPEIAAWL